MLPKRRADWAYYPLRLWSLSDPARSSLSLESSMTSNFGQVKEISLPHPSLQSPLLPFLFSFLPWFPTPPPSLSWPV